MLKKKKIKNANPATVFMSVDSQRRDNQNHFIKLDHALNPSEELLIYSTFFYFYVCRSKTVVSGNSGTHAYTALRILLFNMFYTCIYILMQAEVCAHIWRLMQFRRLCLYPQNQGPDHCFWEGSPRWQLMTNGCIIPGSVAAEPQV